MQNMEFEIIKSYLPLKKEWINNDFIYSSIYQNSFVIYLFIYLFIYFFQVEGEATQRAIVIADQVNLKADTPVLYRTGFGMFV